MKPVTSAVRASSAVLATALSAVLLTSLTTQAPAVAATRATFYVAPDGDDANAGTITAPFRTLQHARDVVRTVNSDMTGDINVYLRGGDYPVSSTIDFTPADSGTNGHHVVYAAYAGEKPVLDGGVQVTGWRQHSGNIWKATLNRDNKLRALYVNGKRAETASKTINSAGCYETYTVTAGQAPWAWESGSQCDGAKYSLSDLPAVASPRTTSRSSRRRPGPRPSWASVRSPPARTATIAWPCSSSRVRPSPRHRRTACSKPAAVRRS